MNPPDNSLDISVSQGSFCPALASKGALRCNSQLRVPSWTSPWDSDNTVARFYPLFINFDAQHKFFKSDSEMLEFTFGGLGKLALHSPSKSVVLKSIANLWFGIVDDA